MAQTNTRLALASYALSAGGACGFSLVALSYLMSAPQDFTPGTVVVAVTNDSTTGPIHVQVRTTWTDQNSAVQTVPLTVDYVSNAATFGGVASTVAPRSVVLLLSGIGAVLPFQFYTGSALQVVILAASTVADAAGVSGQISLWRTLG